MKSIKINIKEDGRQKKYGYRKGCVIEVQVQKGGRTESSIANFSGGATWFLSTDSIQRIAGDMVRATEAELDFWIKYQELILEREKELRRGDVH